MIEELNVRRRDLVGKIGCRKLRKQGFIPATLYHKGDESVSVAIEEHEFLRAIRNHGESALVKLVFEHDKASEQQAVYKNVQTDTFQQRVIHVDLQGVRAGEAITMTVPLNLMGTPVGVTEQAGILMQQLSEVTIRCEPRFIVEQIDIDISQMALHESLTAENIDMPEGLELYQTDPTSVVVSILEPQKAVIETPAEGEEGAEGEGAEGEAAEAKPEGDGAK